MLCGAGGDAAGAVRVDCTIDSPAATVGSVVTGHVTVRVGTPTEISAVRFKILGREYTSIDAPCMTSRDRQPNQRFWKLLLTVEGEGKRAAKQHFRVLPPGTHQFPFSFVLPPILPPTIPLPSERPAPAAVPNFTSNSGNTTKLHHGVRYETKAYCELALTANSGATPARHVVCRRGFLKVRGAISETQAPHHITTPNRCAIKSGCLPCCGTQLIWSTVSVDRTVIAADRHPLTVIIDVDNRTTGLAIEGADVTLHHEICGPGGPVVRALGVFHIAGTIVVGARGVLEGSLGSLDRLDLPPTCHAICFSSRCFMTVALRTNHGVAVPTSEEPPITLVFVSTVHPAAVALRRTPLVALPPGVYENIVCSQPIRDV